MASCALESSTKNRLEDVRAFLFHNLDMLEEYADRDKAAGESRFITLINKREKHLCRSIHRAQSEVRAVCYSPDGSKLARAEGSEVVVCDACTGFVQHTFRIPCSEYESNHFGSISYSPAGDMIAAGSSDMIASNGEIHILDAVTVAVKRSLCGHSGW
jgi:WD40 repeat protein